MGQIYQGTRYMMCAPERVGGSGNPSPQTARGVVCAMEAASEWLGLGNLEGKRIAMQGTGNVGSHMIRLLLGKGVGKIVATEISEALHQKVLAEHNSPRLDVRLVSRDDISIFSEECDVLAPNALGGVLNARTIPTLRTSLVCGAANNQLLDEREDATALTARGIAYVPDFVANRMGIVNCANEQYGSIASDPAIERHFERSWSSSVHQVTCRVLSRAKEEGITPTQAANRLADELTLEPHPIFGYRSKTIIRQLFDGGWANKS
jgi:glutamate dehydrogenase/leucine dehydrogenase